MPKGPRGEHRPADVIGCAVMIARMSVGECEENGRMPSGRVRSGKAGAQARADKLTSQRREDIAKHAAQSRWATK